MKASKRILGLVLALALLLSLSVAAFAKTTSAQIEVPGDDFAAFSIEIGTRTVNFTWKELKGEGAYTPFTATYGAKVDGELTTESWTGVKLADLLAAAEAKLGIELADGYRLSAIAADGFVSTFTVGDVRDAANNYMVAAEAVSNTDGETAYPNSYARIMRGDADTMPNQAAIRCLTGLSVADADGREIALPRKAAGGDVANAIFYIAVKESAESGYRFYYYTRAELEAYDNIYAFDYTDHSVDKVVYGRGAAIKNLLADLDGVTITDDMIVQYAESDGYHADAKTPIEESAYKDQVAWLSAEHVTAGGETAAAVETVVCLDSWTVYDTPTENNVNSTAWEDADAGSGYLRAYRQRDDANSAVIKTLMGLVVSASGDVFTGNDGYTLKAQSVKGDAMQIIEPSTGKAYTSQEITGLVPGMQYGVKAPELANAAVSGDAVKVVTAGEGTETEVVFTYEENAYLTVNDTVYTLSGLQASPAAVQTPSAEEVTAHGTPYGYYDAMYYRYNGVWLSELVSGDATVVGKDGSTLKIAAADLGKYFVAFGNTQSKSDTNVSEGKRFTYSYAAPKLLIPGEGTLVGEAEARAEGNKMVTVAMDGVLGVSTLPFADVKLTDWFFGYVSRLYSKGVVAGMSDTAYEPNGTLTWGQALKLLLVGTGKMEAAPAVDADWAKVYGEKAAELGIVPEAYDLNGQITRLEFCTAAAKLLGLSAEKAAEFPDCTDGYVAALVAQGVISGFEDGTFHPDETLSRAQIARIIDSILGLG